jgi:carboxylate-amine ligase
MSDVFRVAAARSLCAISHGTPRGGVYRGPARVARRHAFEEALTLNRDEVLESSFGSEPAFSVGVEEELFLVDPVTGRQTNSAPAVLKTLEQPEPRTGQIERELHSCQVELISEPRASAGAAVSTLREMRRAVLDTGAGVLASGTHPSALEGEAEITDKERYERICALLGDAVATPVAGLHVHIGMPDSETAIRVFNGLRHHLPLLQALAANSPFRHGRDTGLASAREMTIRGWPRSGVPRAMRDFDDFSAMASLLVRAADVPDYTWFWWKLRPHPRLGTVEVRALDVQIDHEDTAALVALVQCLARHAAESDQLPHPPAELVDEGLFRAARFGASAQLPGGDGHLRAVNERLDDALLIAHRYARELGCAEELRHLPELLLRRGGAGRQRHVYEIAGMDALLRQLTEASAAAAQPPT